MTLPHLKFPLPTKKTPTYLAMSVKPKGVTKMSVKSSFY